MIFILPETSGDLVVIQATEKLTAADYTDTLLPVLEKAISEHGPIRAVFYLDPGFSGWEAGAFWQDLKFGVTHRNDFKRIAIVGDEDWMDWATDLSNHLLTGEAKHFTQSGFLQAIYWVEDAV